MCPSEEFEIEPQPDETSCGPTCLHAVYRYFGDNVSLQRVISETPSLKSGGTLLVFLACHALARGYKATIFTYNLQVFDPTWFEKSGIDVAERLSAQVAVKDAPRLRSATKGYLEFLKLGGRLRFEDLKAGLLRGYLRRGIPIVTGLSATYLYRTPREYGPQDEYDDVRGEPSGHFVVLYDYEKANREVHIADPYHANPFTKGHNYRVRIERVIGAILLGIVTYDANLLIIEPRRSHVSSHHGFDKSDRRK